MLNIFEVETSVNSSTQIEKVPRTFLTIAVVSVLAQLTNSAIFESEYKLFPFLQDGLLIRKARCAQQSELQFGTQLQSCIWNCFKYFWIFEVIVG